MFEFLNAARYLAQNVVRPPLTILWLSSSALEGNAAVIRFEHQLGRLIELWRCRKDYTSNLRMVEQAPWRNLRSSRRVRT